MVRAVAVLLGLVAAVVGVWALVGPASFAAAVDFPPNRHFVHDIGAFQLGIGVTLLLATIWADAFTVALAGYVVGASPTPWCTSSTATWAAPRRRRR